MKIDSIKKREDNSNNTINLKKNDKSKIIKLSYFDIILKDKKNLFFYAILFFIMGLIIFFWFINLKDSLKNVSKLSEEDLKKYNEIKSSYSSVKKDLDSSLKTIIDSLNNLKSNKEQGKEDETGSAGNNNESKAEILDVLSNEQKEEIINNLINNQENSESTNQEVPLEFSQEELKIRLDLLNK